MECEVGVTTNSQYVPSWMVVLVTLIGLSIIAIVRMWTSYKYSEERFRYSITLACFDVVLIGIMVVYTWCKKYAAAKATETPTYDTIGS